MRNTVFALTALLCGWSACDAEATNTEGDVSSDGISHGDAFDAPGDAQDTSPGGPSCPVAVIEADSTVARVQGELNFDAIVRAQEDRTGITLELDPDNLPQPPAGGWRA